MHVRILQKFYIGLFDAVIS